MVNEIEQLTEDIKKMREKNRELESQLAERDELLGPALEAQRRELVRDNGFDPQSVEGKRLIRAMADGEIESDGSNLVDVATGEYGYEPSHPTPNLTKAEVAHQYFADQGQALQAVTFSDDPPSDDQAIKEAEASGDWDTARYLKARRLTKLGDDR